MKKILQFLAVTLTLLTVSLTMTGQTSNLNNLNVRGDLKLLNISVSPDTATILSSSGNGTVGRCSFNCDSLDSFSTNIQHLINSGLWQLNSDSTAIVQVDSTLNVGIGTSSPIAKFHVEGSSTIDSAGFGIRVSKGLGFQNGYHGAGIVGTTGDNKSLVGSFYDSINEWEATGMYVYDTVGDSLVAYIDILEPTGNIRATGNTFNMAVKNTVNIIGNGVNIFGDGAAGLTMQTTSGNVGIGISTPASKLTVSQGDIYVTDIGSGVISKSPDGNCWRTTVDNAGLTVNTSITCP